MQTETIKNKRYINYVIESNNRKISHESYVMINAFLLAMNID